MEMEQIKEISKKIKTNKLLRIEIIVTIICLFLGTLLHFIYQWSGENELIASFSAINESVWEHLKLVFYPMFLMAIIEYFFVKEIANNYVEAKTIGIFSAISFIVVSFFTYTGMIGTNLLLIDILIFVISIILGEAISYKLMKRRNESTIQSKILASIITIFLLICFIVCTYYTPEVNLFRDFTTGVYGIDKA
ncbi:MAG: hypothetical protein HFJ37_04640 [Clostridia bacterium]|nr:hypothetical protein [Clostridia bacterium]